jgi:hypothetical protein
MSESRSTIFWLKYLQGELQKIGVWITLKIYSHDPLSLTVNLSIIRKGKNV